MERCTPHPWRKTVAFDTPSESINKQNKKWKLIFLIAMATVDTFSPSTLRQIFFIDETDGVTASHFASARFWHRWACASKGTPERVKHDWCRWFNSTHVRHEKSGQVRHRNVSNKKTNKQKQKSNSTPLKEKKKIYLNKLNSKSKCKICMRS